MTTSMTTQITAPAPAPDYGAIKGRQRQTWASGDFHVDRGAHRPRQRAAVRHGGPAGRRARAGRGHRQRQHGHRGGAPAVRGDRHGLRARPAGAGTRPRGAEGLPVAFEEGDAEALPVADGAYDVVLSTFGSMFAPDQEQAARELLRACRPGGRIGLVSWTPEGWIGEVFRVTGRHVPPPAGLRPPTRWGTETGLRELLGDGVASLRATRQHFVWRFASAQHYLDLFRTYYGPTVKAFEALDEAGQRALARDLIEAVERFNRSDDGTLLVPSEYLEVVAVKR